MLSRGARLSVKDCCCGSAARLASLACCVQGGGRWGGWGGGWGDRRNRARRQEQQQQQRVEVAGCEFGAIMQQHTLDAHCTPGAAEDTHHCRRHSDLLSQQQQQASHPHPSARTHTPRPPPVTAATPPAPPAAGTTAAVAPLSPHQLLARPGLHHLLHQAALRQHLAGCRCCQETRGSIDGGAKVVGTPCCAVRDDAGDLSLCGCHKTHTCRDIQQEVD